MIILFCLNLLYGTLNTPKLDEKSKMGLEKGMKSGKTHAYRKRCHLVLLKAEKWKSEDVGAILKMHENSVNFWLARYKKEGLEGLKTKKGRGRKSLLDKEKDGESVLAAIKAHRQRAQTAQAAFETAGGKKVSPDTFTRFRKFFGGRYTKDKKKLEKEA